MLRALDAADRPAEQHNGDLLVEDRDARPMAPPPRHGDRRRPVAAVLKAKRAIDSRQAEPDFYELLKGRAGQPDRKTTARKGSGEALRSTDQPGVHATVTDGFDDRTVRFPTELRPIGQPVDRRLAVLTLGLILVLGGTSVGLITLIAGSHADAVGTVAELPLGQSSADLPALAADLDGQGALLPEAPRPRVVAERPTIPPAAEEPAATARVADLPVPSSAAAAATGSAGSTDPSGTPVERGETVAAITTPSSAATGQDGSETEAAAAFRFGSSEPMEMAAAPEAAEPEAEPEPLGYVETTPPSFPDFKAPEAAEPTATRTARSSAGGIATGPATAAAYVNMRAGPDNGAATVTIVPKGAALTVVGCDIWCQVRYDGKNGYVFPSFLTQR